MATGHALSGAQQALLQGAARVLRGARAGRRDQRRSRDPRTRLRAQAAAVAPGYARRLVTDLWLYPDDSRILELSTRCATPEMFQAAAETRAFLAEREVDTSGEQHTKTRQALEFFSRRDHG